MPLPYGPVPYPQQDAPEAEGSPWLPFGEGAAARRTIGAVAGAARDLVGHGLGPVSSPTQRGTQPGPGGEGTSGSASATPETRPGWDPVADRWKTGEDFTADIRKATAGGEAAREAAREAATRSVPAIEAPRRGAGAPERAGVIPDSIRRGVTRSTPEWGMDVPDVSLAGMEANERARQLVEGRHLRRIAAITTEAEARDPQRADLEARQKTAAAEGLLPVERDLYEQRTQRLDAEGKPTGQERVVEEGAFVKKGQNSYATTRPPLARNTYIEQQQKARLSHQQDAIFNDLRATDAYVSQVLATGDPTAINRAFARREAAYRAAGLMLSSLAGRSIERPPSPYDTTPESVPVQPGGNP